MKIYSIAYNSHDQNTYDGTLHYQAERYTRCKYNISNHDEFHNKIVFNFNSHEYDIIAISLTKRGIRILYDDPFKNELNNFKDINTFKPKTLWDHIYRDNIYYIDHHQSHAAYAFLSSEFEESDILAIDGSGVSYRCILLISMVISKI